MKLAALAMVGLMLQASGVLGAGFCGTASWYGKESCANPKDCRTATGERFTGGDMTAAHKTLPFGTKLKVVYGKTGRSVVVRINDRGPFVKGRVLDLSRRAAAQLGLLGPGTGRVCVTVLR